MSENAYSRILCAVDFSDLSAAALRWTAALSSASQATVTALHAYGFDVPPYFGPARAGELMAQYREANLEIRSALSELVEQAGLKQCEVLVEEGDPAEVVLAAAGHVKADLIVMGTHGRRGFQRFMLGSVTERVLRSTSVPLLTVRHPAAVPSIRNILCPVNNSPASRRAFRHAAKVAANTGARLTAVHIDDGEGPGRIDDLCGWVAGQQVPGCDMQELRGVGGAAEGILKMADSLSSDLLVIGATHKAFFDSTVLGVTTVRVVRHARCPVLTVSEGPEAASASIHEERR